MSTVERKTSETTVRVAVGAASATPSAVRTSIPFLDHMLATLARYAALDLNVEASGDLRHHVSEDVAICLGRAIALHAPPECARYGEATVPMDDALVHVAIDLGGRAYYRGPLPSARYDHFMRSFADQARATIHVRVLRGRDRHHIVEAAFKALGLALRGALRRGDAVFSTKGAALLEER
jgi:imidazoleglycerol-phosphate dehydratase